MFAGQATILTMTAGVVFCRRAAVPGAVDASRARGESKGVAPVKRALPSDLDDALKEKHEGERKTHDRASDALHRSEALPRILSPNPHHLERYAFTRRVETRQRILSSKGLSDKRRIYRLERHF